MSDKKFLKLFVIIVGIGLLVMVALLIITLILEPGASLTSFIQKEIW